jgi:NADPH2:quinone reductase
MTAVTAVTVHTTGGPEVLQPERRELPQPSAGQAMVTVAAAGVNFIDIYHRQGVYPRDRPFVPGSEGAGVVAAVGPGVTEVAVGDRVAWESWPGSYASAVVGPVDRLVPVPAGVGLDAAAAVMLQGMTAHYLATDVHPIAPGDVVLIHAGAGGVGLLLTQIAKIRGATVITTVSTPEKAGLSRGAGADEVIVGYHDVPARVRELTGGAGVVAAYDGVGKDTFDGSLASLRRRGILALFGGASGQVPPFDIQRLNRGGSLVLTRPTLADFVTTRGELLARADDLFGWMAGGRLDVRIGGTYPLVDAARAQEDLAARRTTGKLLLIP